MKPRKYKVKSTSHATAKVSDIQITVPKNPQTARTRRVVRTEIIDNAKDPAACVRMILMHQKHHSSKEPWQDTDCFNASNLKAGEEVRMVLSCGQTRRLYEALRDLYAVGADGVPVGEQDLVVVNEGESFIATGREKDLISNLIEQEGQDFFEEVNKLQPDLFEAAAIAKVHRSRRKTVEEFVEELEKQRWSEEAWDTFFRTHKWIFGHGLAYQFLSQLESQPQYGGVTLTGTGGRRGDFLMSTEAQARFTVLVEIKKPNSELVTEKLYRNKVYELSKDLTGGVSQLQSNCRTWVVEGSRQDENRERLADCGTSTYEPKGILVIGHTNQLSGNANQKATFEMFRRNVHNPEIITYDELLERAKYLVSLS